MQCHHNNAPSIAISISIPMDNSPNLVFRSQVTPSNNTLTGRDRASRSSTQSDPDYPSDAHTVRPSHSRASPTTGQGKRKRSKIKKSSSQSRARRDLFGAGMRWVQQQQRWMGHSGLWIVDCELMVCGCGLRPWAGVAAVLWFSRVREVPLHPAHLPKSLNLSTSLPNGTRTGWNFYFGGTWDRLD